MLGISMVVLSLLAAEIAATLHYRERIDRTNDNAAAVILHDTGPERDTAAYVFLDPASLVAAAIQERERDPEVASSTVSATAEAEFIIPLSSKNISDTAVKIGCVQKGDGYKRIVTGTGFMINSRGVILTNAHVAQFLLLKNTPGLGKTSCEATIGTEEKTPFDVGLLYISPSWLLEHASLIGSMAPKGTGESDFALIYITGRRDGAVLENDFSFLPTATNSLPKSYKGKEVTIIGYPKQADKSAPQLIATSTITALYTFGSGYADVFSLASSTLGHQGVSGGPVVDEYGRAIGVLTTKDAGTTVLNAITTAHIDRSLRRETGYDLTSYSQGDIDYKASLFNETISPFLQEILAGYLTEQNP